MLEEIGKPLDAVILLQVSDEVATERLRSRASQEGRADDSPEAIREPAPPLPRAHGARRRALPDRGHRGRPSTANRPWTTSSRRSRTRWSGSPRADDHPQERARDREDRRGGALVAETIAHVGSLLRPGHHDGRARRRRRRLHPRARRHPDLRGLQGLPEGDLHLAERRRRSRNPRRVRRRRRRPRDDRRRRHARRLHRRQRVHVRRGGDRRGGSNDCSTSLRTRSPRESPTPSSGTASATSRTRSRSSSRPPGSPSSAASSGTASAATTTRIRTFRTSASRAAARACPRE